MQTLKKLSIPFLILESFLMGWLVFFVFTFGFAAFLTLSAIIVTIIYWTGNPEVHWLMAILWAAVMTPTIVLAAVFFVTELDDTSKKEKKE